jgi:hypothetical protein
VAAAEIARRFARGYGIKSGVHLDVIEQGRPPMCQPFAIDGGARHGH